MAEHDTPGTERSDLSARGVMWFAILLATTIALVFIGVRFFESALSRNRSAPTVNPRLEAPGPRLQTNPARDLAALRAAEEARLHSYGWVDRQARVIHIPIERAIELTAQRGLPARAPTKGVAP